ncbi:hypothetical protein SNOG_15962 [Parastagonospora nodorum SN15]|uniref:Uncharacterized protein n=1 Tax=Phaeosphaeria nodorum (strain SN15 / ATCC MYA-4574 / FGSC 10173) TaxID=321614 RepID=Q0TWN9_PHANO|nr:hypothetical protein SNOG_15962 [Parastagonospora nodorum SN15]EAT76541.1 hypothetical protein SNOG_15962 [Parastagonospora nodorum SN15]
MTLSPVLLFAGTVPRAPCKGNEGSVQLWVIDPSLWPELVVVDAKHFGTVVHGARRHA